MNSRMARHIDSVSVLMATSGSPGWAVTMYIATAIFQPLHKELCRMKKVILSSALAFTMAFSSAAFAQMGQSGATGQGSGQWHGQRGPMSADQRLQMLTQQLN